jgi:hypothetical protein
VSTGGVSTLVCEVGDGRIAVGVASGRPGMGNSPIMIVNTNTAASPRMRTAKTARAAQPARLTVSLGCGVVLNGGSLPRIWNAVEASVQASDDAPRVDSEKRSMGPQDPCS